MPIENIISTTKKVENDTEYFEVDPYLALDPEPEEEEVKPDIAEEDKLKIGTDLINDEIDATKAYEFFLNLEGKSRAETIRQPETERGGLMAPISSELPSQRL